MRIGIDMRMAGTGEGIGRYIEELVKHLALIDQENDYILLFQDSASSAKFRVQNPKFRNVVVQSKYYSLAEQTTFIGELRRLHLDLMHFSSFNAPIFYPGKFVVTIHDIIHHLYPGKKKARFFYRLAYHIVISAAIRKASRVIAVSEVTRNDILRTFHVEPARVQIVYEGAPKSFSSIQSQPVSPAVAKKYDITKPYLFFVGVWRQYKNLPRLAQAFDILKERYGHDCQMVFAGKIDPFYPEIRKAVYGIRHADDLRSLGFVSEEDLPELYRGASVFVLPSLIEGFGLIGIEAQAAGLPVAASGIAVLREVLGDGAVYFDPENIEEMAEKIHTLLANADLRQKLIAFGQKNSSRFDWKKTADQTLKIYLEAAGARKGKT